MAGKVWLKESKKQQRRRPEFTFDVGDKGVSGTDPSATAKPKRRRPVMPKGDHATKGRKGTIKSSRKAEVDSDHSSDDVDTGKKNGSDDTSNKKSSSSSSSSTSSSSSSSSTSSSSDESEGSKRSKGSKNGTDVDDSDGPEKVSEKRAAHERGKDVASGSRATPSRVSEPEKSLPGEVDTTWWKGFRFTKTFTRLGVHKGYEVACYYHDSTGSTCRRKRDFSAHGGIEKTTLMLKNWCAMCTGYATSEDHKSFPNVLPDDEAALEALKIPKRRKEAMPPRGAKRRRA